MFILKANDINNKTIGGKANGLYQLQALGLNVPAFIVLPFESINIHSAAEINSFILNEYSTKQLKEFLKNCEAEKKGVSVRSSVADEDGAQYAFSGIMKTYLNQRKFEDVLLAIKNCIASAFSEQAIQYRKINNLTLDIKTAVIVQQQINSEISGVMFTTNPKYPQELAIHSVYGQGEGLVSGELDADEFYFLKNNATFYRKKYADKTSKYILNDVGLINIPLSNELVGSESISADLVLELFNTGILLERTLKHPQDIEFAIASNKIWYLQSRAITQKIEELVVFDNSNIQESYSGVISPLTFSFAQRAYATVYTQTMKALQLPQSTIDAHKNTVENLLGIYKGRIYYNINNWYKGLQLLPSFKQNKADMERMMGLKEPVEFVINTEKSFVDKLKLLPSLISNIVKLSIAFFKLEKSIKTFIENFTAYHTQFYNRLSSNENYTLRDLWQEKELLDINLLNKWSVPIINDFYVMMQNGKVHRVLKSIGIENPDLYLSKFKFGTNGIASYKQGIALEKLANQINLFPDIKTKIINNDVDIHSYITQHHPTIYKNIEEFVNDYGDRTIAELKLETITMRIDRAIFYKYLKIYLNNTNTSFEQTNPDTEIMPKSVRKLLISIKNREALRLKRTHLFGMYRTIYLSIADILFKQHKIHTQTDIFYLNEKEIELAIKNSMDLNLIEIIENRKTECLHYTNVEVPDRVYFPMPIDTNNLANAVKKDTLQGEGCAGGIVVGEAIVVDNVNDDLEVQGKIIIAKRTDPGWISLFPSSMGVIIERGSSLSHSVILLREMNKPSIINVPELLQQIRTGDVIELNPLNGEIKIITYGKN